MRSQLQRYSNQVDTVHQVQEYYLSPPVVVEAVLVSQVWKMKIRNAEGAVKEIDKKFIRLIRGSVSTVL